MEGTEEKKKNTRKFYAYKKHRLQLLEDNKIDGLVPVMRCVCVTWYEIHGVVQVNSCQTPHSLPLQIYESYMFKLTGVKIAFQSIVACTEVELSEMWKVGTEAQATFEFYPNNFQRQI